MNSERSRYLVNAFVVWLMVVFAVGLVLRFASPGSDPEELETSLRFSERLTLVGEFSETFSPSAKRALLQTAVQLEEDPLRQAVIRGEQPHSVETLGELSPGYRALAEYRASPSPEARGRLQAMANSAQQRLQWCCGGLALLFTMVVGTALFGGSQREKPPSWTSWSPLWCVGLFLLWDAGNLFGIGLALSALRDSMSPFSLVLLAQMLGYLWLAGLLYWARRGRPWNLRWRFPTAWVGRGYLLGLLAVLGVNLLLGWLTGTPPVSQNALLGLFVEASPWQLTVLGLLVVVVGPFFEELIFRGWLLGGLREPWGESRALLFSALLFALIHGDPQSTPALFGLGLAFGWVYLRAGSLYANILVHALWNATTFTFLLAGMP